MVATALDFALECESFKHLLFFYYLSLYADVSEYFSMKAACGMVK